MVIVIQITYLTFGRIPSTQTTLLKRPPHAPHNAEERRQAGIVSSEMRTADSKKMRKLLEETINLYSLT